MGEKQWRKGKLNHLNINLNSLILLKSRRINKKSNIKKIADMFKTLHINVAFVKSLAQMPRYAKFLKELLTNKRKLEEVSSVTLRVEH